MIQNFINKSNSLHGNKYNYSKTIYKNCYTKVTIICKDHGEFVQRPKDHIRSKGLHTGCPKCGDIKAAISRTKSTEYFLEKAKESHGDKFDYSKVDYKNIHTNVKIICKKHSLEFEVTPSNFISNIHNCPECFKEKNSTIRITNKEFIEECNKVHNNLYDYSKTKYCGAFEKVIIICKKHGEFYQSGDAHKNKLQGCPHCCTSNGELAVKSYLEQNNINFIQQKIFAGCAHKGLLKFDFYLPDHNIAIEFQGRQHFEEVSYFGGKEGFQETLLRDQIKENYCRNFFIKLICLSDISEIEQKLSKISFDKE